MITKPTAQTRAISAWAVRSVVFASFLDLYMQIPIMATYAAQLGASASRTGLIVGMYSATNLLGNFLAGILLDKMNRKWLVTASLALTIAAVFAYAVVETWEQLLALRAWHGLVAGGLAPGSFAMLGDRARTQNARSMGMIASMIAVAAVMGPPLSGVLSHVYEVRAVFVVSGTVMLLSAVAFAAVAPSSSAAADSAADARSETTSFGSIFRSRAILSVFALTLAMTFAIGALITHLPLLVDLAGGSARLTGFAFAAFSAVATLVMLSPALRAADGASRPLAVAGGLLALAVSLASLGALGFAAAFPAMAVFGVGFGMLFPALGAALAERSASRQRGAAFGIFYSVYSLGVFLGSLAAGFALEAAPGYIGAPFLVAALAPLLAAPIALGLRPRRESPTPN